MSTRQQLAQRLDAVYTFLNWARREDAWGGDTDDEGNMVRCTFAPQEMFHELASELASDDYRCTTDGTDTELKWKIRVMLSNAVFLCSFYCGM